MRVVLADDAAVIREGLARLLLAELTAAPGWRSLGRLTNREREVIHAVLTNLGGSSRRSG